MDITRKHDGIIIMAAQLAPLVVRTNVCDGSRCKDTDSTDDDYWMVIDW